MLKPNPKELCYYCTLSAAYCLMDDTEVEYDHDGAGPLIKCTKFPEEIWLMTQEEW